MGQKGNNDDFIVYLTDSDASKRTTICLSAANLLRIYNNGVGLDDNDITLEYNNMVYNKKVSDYQYHVVTNGLTNGGTSEGMTLEIYVSYEDLGIKDPDSIKMCFNYNDVSMVSRTKVAEDNYLTNSSATDGAEKNIESYFQINELINQ